MVLCEHVIPFFLLSFLVKKKSNCGQHLTVKSKKIRLITGQINGRCVTSLATFFYLKKYIIEVNYHFYSKYIPI